MSQKVLQKYKNAIKREYMPSRGYGRASSRESRRVVSDFKKTKPAKKDIIDLLLYRAEMMIAYTAAYGDIDMAYYNSLASSFDEGCNMIKEEGLESEYKVYCEEMRDSTRDFGWGIYDDLAEVIEMYLEV